MPDILKGAPSSRYYYCCFSLNAERISLDLKSLTHPPTANTLSKPLKGRGSHGLKNTQEFALHAVSRVSSLLAMMTASYNLQLFPQSFNFNKPQMLFPPRTWLFNGFNPLKRKMTPLFFTYLLHVKNPLMFQRPFKKASLEIGAWLLPQGSELEPQRLSWDPGVPGMHFPRRLQA